MVLGDSVSEPDMYLAALWPGQGGLRWSVSLSPWTQLNINVRSSHEAPVTSQRIFPVMRHIAVMSHCTGMILGTQSQSTNVFCQTSYFFFLKAFRIKSFTMILDVIKILFNVM